MIETINCDFCDKKYRGKNARTNVRKHIIHCINNPDMIPYHCCVCNNDYNNRYCYIAHHRTCGKVFVKKVKKESSSFRCKYCDIELYSIPKIASHVSNCKLNPDYERIRRKRSECGKIPRKHTQETKDKISISRKEYLRNNPDKVPYLLNHSRNESYPEKYFSDIFEKEGLIVEKAVRIGLYELDFSVPSKRIDIEIDGSQHYCDKKILESDIRRNEFLEQNGWDIIRINWSNYQKMSFDEKKEYIRNLISYINDISTSKPSIPFIKHIRGKNLCMCGELKYTRSKSCKDCRTKIEKVDKKRHKAVKKRYDKQILCSTCGNTSTKGRCIKCYQLGSRKVERPTYEDLLKDISDLGYCGTGRKYGVSDNSIRKWIKNYQMN